VVSCQPSAPPVSATGPVGCKPHCRLTHNSRTCKAPLTFDADGEIVSISIVGLLLGNPLAERQNRVECDQRQQDGKVYVRFSP
jgi:hypothetical protein